jgi:hypothetical protein
MRSTLRFLVILGVAVITLSAAAQDFEREPINYGKRQPQDRVAKLLREMKDGQTKLAYDEKFGYLPAVLEALDVPRSSQMLVFSKTSLQRQRIAPRTPRAIYFSDDVYVGYCQDGEVLEISTVDPQLGANFYTVDQEDFGQPQIHRQQDNCLICHASSANRSVPGHLVRSVFSDTQGLPILSSGSYRTDHTSPFEQRWGGWYVTGTHGAQKHLGNFIVRGRNRPEEVDNSDGQNVTDLKRWFNTDDYLTPHSDLVALMVMEHQVLVHNAATYANFATQQALHFDLALSRDLGEQSSELRDSTKSRIKSGCEPLVEALLFCEEAPLKGKVAGTSDFAAEFTRRGPFHKDGRSLREFDLTSRMFKYPCSYLIYSTAVTGLPADAKSFVFRRLHEVLSEQNQDEKFKHLSPADRNAIREILAATHDDFRASVE